MERYEDPAFYTLLADSYARVAGGRLAPEGLDALAGAKWLYEEAPYGILAHTPDADPVFMYGNRAAQRRFGYSWEELTRLPSRLSAEAPDREARQRFLEQVQRDGYSSGYRGIRVMKDGKRFYIEDATLWQLFDTQGGYHGQAVIIPRTRDV